MVGIRTLSSGGAPRLSRPARLGRDVRVCRRIPRGHGGGRDLAEPRPTPAAASAPDAQVRASSPPPTPRYVPPPPPPAVAVTPRPATVPHKRIVKHHVKRRPKKKSSPKVQLKTPIAAPLQPANRRPKSLATALSVGQVDSRSSPESVALALGGTLALSLVLLGLALAPLRILPRTVQGVVYERREPLLYTAGVIYFTTGLSLAIALFMS